MSDAGNDSSTTMGEISRNRGSSIIDLLLDIQKNRTQQRKNLKFIRALDCLKPDTRQRMRLSREQINGFNCSRYVALSYTWEASQFEDPTCGRYQIQCRDHRRSFHPSPVRNCVFDRILKYMKKQQIELLWIDNHSLQQAICKEADCEHSECEKNREDLEVMDLVYKFSAHPVALLSTPIRLRTDMKILKKVLSGVLVANDRSKSVFRISEQTNQDEVVRAIALLHKLTRDPWWERGWIFQESYRAGNALRLLLPHSSKLQRLKQSLGFDLFGNIHEELCINATRFSYETTRLCLAFNEIKDPPRKSKKKIRDIIETAGRYTLILEEHVSMSPTIFSHINKRRLKRERHWDQLAIAANCCQYSIRMDTHKLKRENKSFSISKLALYLLNGELLRNDVPVGNPSELTVLDFLSSQSFKGFYAPMSQRSLTFNKGCRLTDVKLTRNGVSTKGHLWKLGRVIQPEEIIRQPLLNEPREGRLEAKQHLRLAQLADTLEDYGHDGLVELIWDFLTRDVSRGGYTASFDSFADSYMTMMASKLVDAIDRGIPLVLGCIFDPSRRSSRYRAIFICEGDSIMDELDGPITESESSQHESAIVFTASAPRRKGNTIYGSNDLDRHVSLEVDIVGTQQSIPRLQTRSWILGLCFFKGIERTEVLFPWPLGLEGITP